MEVVALYPSIVRDMVKKVVLKAISETDIVWVNVENTNLTRYIAMATSRKEIEKMF